MNDTPKNDKSEYTDTGLRGGDARQGFGDDAGTRVGRPDGAGSNASAQDPTGGARVAPLDAQGGERVPGQAGTNTTPVPDGIEGSDIDGQSAAGAQQARVQEAAEGLPASPDSYDTPAFDL